MELSVIIPAYNAERELAKTVHLVFNYLSSHNISHEIIVVPDGATDHTLRVAESLKASIPTLSILSYPNNHGKGYAVRKGMLHAQGDYRLFMDADNSTTIDHIKLMMPYFAKGYSVVIGSIRAPGFEVAEGSEPWYRTFLGRLSNIYTQMVLLPGIKDTQRGFKIFTANAAQEIFSCSHIDRFGFDMEALALARKFGYRIIEVPVRWHNDPHTASHPRLSAYVQVFMDTLRIKWWLMTDRYSRGRI